MTVNDHRVITESANLPYVRRPVPIHRFSPALRQVVMAGAPDFFGWDAEKQDRFRRDTDDSFDRAFSAKLKSSIAARLGLRVKEVDFENPYRGPLTELNTLKQPFVGIGESVFSLSEWTTDWYDMETVADLSRQHYASDPDRPENREPYMGQLFPLWARYLDGDRLIYSTLNAFHHYVYDQLNRQTRTQIGELIPHDFVEGPNDGKPDGKGNIEWDMRIDAGGLEGQLDELKERSHKHMHALYIRALHDCHQRESGAVYRNIVSDWDDPMTTWVFDGVRAMEGVRLTHFRSDLTALRRDARELRALVAPYLEDARQQCAKDHADIMKNWNPKVAKLKKRMRVMVASRAFDSLTE